MDKASQEPEGSVLLAWGPRTTLLGVNRTLAAFSECLIPPLLSIGPFSLFIHILG